MKRIIAILLAAIFAVTLAACSKSAGENLDELFQTVLPADEALALAKDSEAVVFDKRGLASGKDVWDAFCAKVENRSPATVICAHYYVLDKDHMTEEAYEKEKDEYPRLFFYLVEYDGEQFSVKTRDSASETLDSSETFKYLLHFTGKAPSRALYSEYDNYVLVDDPSATWEGIEEGLYSSQSDAYVKHCTVYSDCIGWKEG